MKRSSILRVAQVITALSVALILVAGSALPALAGLLLANGAIAGLVTCEGSPVASVVISVIPSASTEPIWTGMTQADGRYYTDLILPPGTYTVRNYYNLGVCQYPQVTQSAIVLSAETTTINFAGTACTERIRNGGFELVEAWLAGPTPWPARYSGAQFHAGATSMRSGIEPPEGDRLAESSFYQAITLPADVASVTLSFWYLPFTQETASAPADWQDVSWAGYSPQESLAGPFQASREAEPMPDATSFAAYDWQEVLILNQYYQPLEVLQRGLSDAGSTGWQYRSYDLTPYRGRTIVVYFNTLNNGVGNRRTWMFVDDVALRTCNQPPACSITPTNRWVSLFGLRSTFHSSLLQPNQIVRAYDPAGVLAGCYVVRSAGRYGAMAVYADDPETPADEGMSPGETIRLTVEGQNAAALGPDAPTWTENGALLQVELDVGSSETRAIALRAGWNLFSFDVMPPDAATETLLAPLAGKFTRVLGSTCSDGALSYYPSLPAGMNTLRTLDPYHGYWIYMNEAATLSVAGPEVPDGAPLSLCPRWNLVSYLPDAPQAVTRALASIDDALQVALGFDQGALSFYPDLPNEMNSLQSLAPGLGYWMRASVTTTLTYPPANALAEAALSLPQRDDRPADITPTNRWADAYSLGSELDGEPLPVGAVVEAFDPQGVKVGRSVVRFEGRYGPMPIYGDDPSTPEDEGARAGDRLTFTINGLPAMPMRGIAMWRGERTLMRIDLRTRAQ